MTDIMKLTEQVLSDKHTIRVGYSETHKAAYIVAQDIRQAMNYTAGTNVFLRQLEEDQNVSAGQDKGAYSTSPLYVGSETIQTAGGPQRMKVVYKRGVFQLLMTSRRPEAVQYKDKIFDILEEIERDGVYIQPSMPEALRVRADEKFSYHKLKDFVVHASDYDPSSEASRKAFARMQNRMYAKIVGLDAEGIKAAREVNTQMLAKTRKDGKPYAADLKVAKNYLQSEELADLNNAALGVVGILGLRMRPFGGVYTMQQLHDTLTQVLDAF
jgi:prophage antirepressor-like protein